MAKYFARLFGGRNRKEQAGRDAATAVIDAATIYGASRWLNRVHEDPHWKFAKQYRAAEDRLLFHEFLFDVLLYDLILLDHSSVNIVSDEIQSLIDFINNESRRDIIRLTNLAPHVTRHDVADTICRLLSKVREHDDVAMVSDIPVPWYYRHKAHHDRRVFETAAREWQLPDSLIPVALFMYRGLCYSGYANHYSQEHSTPSAYLASPGRMQVLEPILSKEAINKFAYPKNAYADLVNRLKLPKSGYDFSHLSGTEFARMSELTEEFFNAPPDDALSSILTLRQNREAIRVRRDWAARLWDHSSSCAVGVARGNSITKSNIYGNVTQVIVAST
jgi:hypothetical protein